MRRQPVNRGLSTTERMRLYQQHAPAIAREAASQAFRDAHLDAADVTHLVTISCTGFSAPGVDLSLFESLSLPPTLERVHVGYMGCHGVINGLRAAKGLADADQDAVVLMCAVETCSTGQMPRPRAGANHRPAAASGDLLWSSSSTIVSIPERFGRRSRSTSPSSGGISRGTGDPIPTSRTEATVFLGLALLSARQNKIQRTGTVDLDLLSSIAIRSLFRGSAWWRCRSGGRSA